MSGICKTCKQRKHSGMDISYSIYKDRVGYYCSECIKKGKRKMNTEDKIEIQKTIKDLEAYIDALTDEEGNRLTEHMNFWRLNKDQKLELIVEMITYLLLDKLNNYRKRNR